MAISSVKATINGQTYNLTYNSSSGAYEATITAPSTSSYKQSGHYYGVSITAYDDSGNYSTINQSDATFGNELKLYVTEKVAPTITVTSPTSGALLTNNKPTFSFTCTDADSGVNPDTIKMKIDGTSVTPTKTASGNTYTCAYTPTTALTNGEHTITYDCTDYDGNVSSKTIKVTIDTVAPTLTVSAPADKLKTNVANVTVSGTTNDATSSPVTLTVNGNAVTVGTNGAFSTSITLTEGTNTITVKSTDGAGLSTTVTRTVYYDSKAPVFNSVSITPNPVDAGKTFVISVKVTD